VKEGKNKKNKKKQKTKNDVMIFMHVVALSFKMSAFVQQSDGLAKRETGGGGKEK
jgi:hypothetical protein